MEEFGRTLMPGVFLETSAFAVPIINQFATTEQKQQYLSEVASGEKAFTIAWLEPGRSYTEKGIQLEAILEQEQFTLNGMKTQVADVAFAQYLIVPVRVNGEVSIIVHAIIIIWNIYHHTAKLINTCNCLLHCFDISCNIIARYFRLLLVIKIFTYKFSK